MRRWSGRREGCDEEGEDEGRERPERPVKVGRGGEVGGGVGRREGGLSVLIQRKMT